MDCQSGVKKASSGSTNAWPGNRSPGRGKAQMIRLAAFTSIRRLLPLSAISNPPGSISPGAHGGTTPAHDRGVAVGGIGVTVGVLVGAVVAVSVPVARALVGVIV